MDPLTIAQLAFSWGGTIKSILDQAMSNDDLMTKLSNLAKPVGELLSGLGGQLFPQVKPQLQAAAAAMAAFNPDVTKWLQGSLNAMVEPSPNLVVDGLYGPKTKAAVALLQAKLGLTVDGWAGQMTQAAISAALAK